MSTGSLGQGISAACGMALAAKLQNNPCRVYALLGDGEIQEGQVWEAMMFAHHYKLDNLRVIIDNNGLQIDGPVDQVMSPYPILDKLSAFGFETAEIDGHDFDALEGAFTQANAVQGRPLRHRDENGEGQGGQLYGKPGGLARQGPQPGAVRSRPGGAEGHTDGIGGGVTWRT